MRRKYNQSIYDSNKAAEIVNHVIASPSDLEYCNVTLQRTRIGHYFYHVIGGKTCAYAKQLSFQPGEELGETIVPISYAQAKEFGEKHMMHGSFDKEFGEVPAEGSKRQKTVMLSEDVIHTLEKRKKKYRISYSDSIDQAVRTAFDTNDTP